MKLLSFHYHLKINMDAPIQGHHFTLRCMPVSDQRQKILHLQHFIFPSDFLSTNLDHWGNALLYGCCRDTHSSFEANVCGEAAVGLSDAVPSRPGAADGIFCIPTPLTAADRQLCALAAGLHGSGVRSIAENAAQLVHDSLVYTPGVTGVNTTAAEALALGKGVCQDYAQILLAVLRARGIPCRYAAGMLLGEGKSHAWTEVLADGFWYGLDPTNGSPVSDQHIKLSHGRDAADCAINRGIFRGCAAQSTDISAIVTELR